MSPQPGSRTPSPVVEEPPSPIEWKIHTPEYHLVTPPRSPVSPLLLEDCVRPVPPLELPPLPQKPSEKIFRISKKRDPPGSRPLKPPGSIRPRQARALEQKAKRREDKANKAKLSIKKHFSHCKPCKIALNSYKQWYDHINGKAHKIRVRQLHEADLLCRPCKREFESKYHLDRHLKGGAHLKVVSRLAKNNK